MQTLVSFTTGILQRQTDRERDRKSKREGIYSLKVLFAITNLFSPESWQILGHFTLFHSSTRLPVISLIFPLPHSLSGPCNLSLENSLLVFSYLYKSALLLSVSLYLSFCKNHAQWTRFSHLLDAWTLPRSSSQLVLFRFSIMIWPFKSLSFVRQDLFQKLTAFKGRPETDWSSWFYFVCLYSRYTWLDFLLWTQKFHNSVSVLHLLFGWVWLSLGR